MSTTVSPADDTVPANNSNSDVLQDDHSAEVLLGMVKGLLTDSDDADLCQLDGLSAVEGFRKVAEDLQNDKFVEVATDLSDALANVDPLVSDCQAVKDEAHELVDALKVLTPDAAQANFKAHE